MSSAMQQDAFENAELLFVPAIKTALEHLVPSVEPAVVFTSLARLCVPLVCDSTTVVVIGAEDEAYRISWPMEPTGSTGLALVDTQRITDDSVLTPFVIPAVDNHSACRGMLALSYRDRRPTPAEALLGQFLVDHTIAVIRTERLTAAWADEVDRVANLQLALASNRDIGVAMGILMAGSKVTSQGAFDLLRTASQNTHRKLRDVAVDVALTGTLDTPSASPGRTDRVLSDGCSRRVIA